MNKHEVCVDDCGLRDADWKGAARKWFFVSAALILITSIFSYGVWRPDEYQPIEFASLKLGITTPANLSWEYGVKLRPWLQSSIYYALAKTSYAVGIKNAFTIITFYRLLDGIFGLTAIALLMLYSYTLFKNKTERTAALICISLAWFLPYILVRTSSESPSLSLCAIALMLLLLCSRRVKDERRRYPAWLLPASGFIFGLSFEFRFQIAFFIVGIGLWLVFFGSETIWRGVINAAILFAGFSVAVGLGALIDRWGYGEWTFTPYNYYYQNVVLGIAAKNFGSKPAWWYIFNSADMFGIGTWLFFIAMIIAAIRYPKSPLVWGSVIFFIAHSVTAHKETRFIFPIYIYYPLFLALAAAPNDDVRYPKWLRAVWDSRGKLWAKILYGINILMLVVMCFYVRNANFGVRRYVYNRYPDTFAAYYFKRSPYYGHFSNWRFTCPRQLKTIPLTNYAGITAIAETNTQPVFCFDFKSPTLKSVESFSGAVDGRAVILYPPMLKSVYRHRLFPKLSLPDNSSFGVDILYEIQPAQKTN